MKKLIIPVLAIVLAISSSAFTAKRTSSVLYQYTGTTFTQSAIQDINNYVRVDDEPCDDGSDVCGVLLPTDEGVGNQPDATEFSNKAAALWDAQQHGTTDTDIQMKP